MLSDDLSEQLDDALDIARQRTILNPVGEAAKGLLANPNLAFLIGGGILAAVSAVVGKDVIDKVTSYLGSLGVMTSPEASQEDKAAAAGEAALTLKDIIDTLTLGATGLLPP